MADKKAKKQGKDRSETQAGGESPAPQPDESPAEAPAPTTAEHARLAEADAGVVDWRDWGPYLAERAWGSVREDYSAEGDAWTFFPHDHARSRSYRWNEDGMAGFSDAGQRWCLALALWNGQDAILKERMFGLNGHEGNHGEDAKDYWWYLDGTPTHSLQRWRYHYPQAAFPYEDLLSTNHSRGQNEPEYELTDTGIFDEGRYWVVEATYAKAGPHDLLLELTVENAGPETATIEVLPTLWFRNTWTWDEKTAGDAGAELALADASIASPDGLALHFEPAMAPEPLFCDNETNVHRLFGPDAAAISAYPKDGINDHVVSGAPSVNPGLRGSKAALRYRLTVPAGEKQSVRLRLTQSAGPVDGGSAKRTAATDPFADFDATLATRSAEADAFHDAVAPSRASADEKRVLRQAFAGLTWAKQFYHYDVKRWLAGDPAFPPPPAGRGAIRNGAWQHLAAHDVILMPDPWEYPWFAAWDLAFHCLSYAHIDPEFAKAQLVLILREWYTHPSAQLPAYEWDFGDVNPPTQARAALGIFELGGSTDHLFLARVFQKLSFNFIWWVNNKDAGHDDLFEGGFLGLDNIAPINRSMLPPQFGRLEQADATAWMAVYALDLLEMAVTLAKHDLAYEDVALTFFEQFLGIADAANQAGLWDEADAFYYDVLTLPGGQKVPLKVRSLVGLVPVTASLAVSQNLDGLDGLASRIRDFISRDPGLGEAYLLHPREDVNLLALVSPERLERILTQVFDENGMLSPHGIRSISAWHRENPFTVSVGGLTETVDYEPGESTSGLFGGNSNWRGPVWFPLNVLIIDALRSYETALGEKHLIEFPAGSGTKLNYGQIADALATRLISLFTPGPDGSPRPSDARYPLLSTDPRWRDGVFFYEYFHGDTGQGLGASHQTGWTALVARLILTRG